MKQTTIQTAIAQISLFKEKGIEGCTFGDTKHDSVAAAYGYNLAIENVLARLRKLLPTEAEQIKQTYEDGRNHMSEIL